MCDHPHHHHHQQQQQQQQQLPKNDKSNDDGWTFVSNRKHKRKQHSKHKKHETQMETAKMIRNVLTNSDYHNDDDDWDTDQHSSGSNIGKNDEIDTRREEQCKALAQCIEHCMNEIHNFQTFTSNSCTHYPSGKHKNKQCKNKMTFRFQSLLASLQKASSYNIDNTIISDTGETNETGKENNNNNNNTMERRQIHEIVCYGIGNFAIQKNTRRQTSSSKHEKHKQKIQHQHQHQQQQIVFDATSSPMIQLACILLIRKTLALDIFKKSVQTKISHLSYQDQQKLVPMVYFEPFIRSIETKVLTEFFHVQVLDVNERGKRCIMDRLASTCTTNDEYNTSSTNEDEIKQENMGKEQKQGLEQDLNVQDSSFSTSDIIPKSKHPQPSPITIEAAAAAASKTATLFYMPHCPMRLYSNVLWANWTPNLDLLLNGRIIILGNSFKAYDDRIVSSQHRKDSTNAIFPLLPFVKEEGVFVSSSSSSSSSTVSSMEDSTVLVNSNNTEIVFQSFLSWQELEMAFNDCVVISFQKDVDKNDNTTIWPMKPDEHTSEDDSYGEVV